MGVAKLTSSKRAVQFITDEGVVYQASADFIIKLVSGQWKGDFMVLSRMSNGVAPDRFPKSPVYGEPVTTHAALSTANDALSVAARKKVEEVKPIIDNKVSW